MLRRFLAVAAFGTLALGFMLTLLAGCPAGPPQPEHYPGPTADDGDGDEARAAQPEGGKYKARRACRMACKRSAQNCKMACRQQTFECNKAGRPGHECAQVYKQCFAPCRIDHTRCRQACRQNN